ncbi:hypothetical protein WAI453_004758 [Rhynchosporium graminicola]
MRKLSKFSHQPDPFYIDWRPLSHFLNAFLWWNLRVLQISRGRELSLELKVAVSLRRAQREISSRLFCTWLGILDDPDHGKVIFTLSVSNRHRSTRDLILHRHRPSSLDCLNVLLQCPSSDGDPATQIPRNISCTTEILLGGSSPSDYPSVPLQKLTTPERNNIALPPEIPALQQYRLAQAL